MKLSRKERKLKAVEDRIKITENVLFIMVLFIYRTHVSFEKGVSCLEKNKETYIEELAKSYSEKADVYRSVAREIFSKKILRTEVFKETYLDYVNSYENREGAT